MPHTYYVSTCPETGRQFLCEVGVDNNICEITPELFSDLRDALSAAADYLGTLVRDDGSAADDAHPSRSHHADLCQMLDRFPTRALQRCPSAPQTGA